MSPAAQPQPQPPPTEDLRRVEFLAGLAEDFSRLRSDPEAWAAELEERAAWDRVSVQPE